MANEGEYRSVANKKDLHEGGLLKAEFLGKPIVLSMVNGEVYALDAVCSHEGGPLEDVTLEGYVELNIEHRIKIRLGHLLEVNVLRIARVVHKLVKPITSPS